MYLRVVPGGLLTLISSTFWFCLFLPWNKLGRFPICSVQIIASEVLRTVAQHTAFTSETEHGCSFNIAGADNRCVTANRPQNYHISKDSFKEEYESLYSNLNIVCPINWVLRDVL